MRHDISFQSALLRHSAKKSSRKQRVLSASAAANDLDWMRIRKFLMFGFSDAAGLERRADEPGMLYEQAQNRIFAALETARNALADASNPVVMIAQSLGGHVLSNYLWDAQAQQPGRGIWKNSPPTGTPADDFQRLKTMRRFFTTGCNIPVIVAGLEEADIRSVSAQGNGYDFEWHNFFDKDDVLGWPLKPLSQSYAQAVVEDHEINAGSLLTSWSPLSHTKYWGDRDFLQPTVTAIESLL